MIKPKSRKHEDRIKALESQVDTLDRAFVTLLEQLGGSKLGPTYSIPRMSIKSDPWWKRLWG